jgi:glucose/arabinose dehydrogenase
MKTAMRGVRTSMLAFLALLSSAILQFPGAVIVTAAALLTVSGTAAGAVNVAAEANGGIASGSSTYSAGFPASGANNGDRKGLDLGNGGAWADATENMFPDVLQINFNGTYTINTIDLFTVQDNVAAPEEPTALMTFTQWGVTAFQVQHWNGSAWIDVPGANVTGNNLVWRRFSFAPIVTNAVRVVVTAALNGHARITEVEAWTAPPPGTKLNVAAQANGAVATASSIYSPGFPASAVNNGDRRGLNLANGGAWADETENNFPDVLQINFNGTYTVDEIDVFTVQDNVAAPDEPTALMTFTQWGITAFQIEYWNGSTWLEVPAANITGNNLVWRHFSFAPVATNAIRVVVTAALNGHARITEVEAWTAASGSPSNLPPTVNLTSPVNNSMVDAPVSVSLSAMAADQDGAISKVEFYRDAMLIATVVTPVAGAYIHTDANVGVGTYRYVAVAYDNASPPAVMTSAAAVVSVSATLNSSVNVAAQLNGGVVSASSTLDARFPVSGVNNGDRKGTNWGSGGGWADATPNIFPDVVQVSFNSTYRIGEIDVFTVQDNFGAPAEPTASTTFTQWGITAFRVQYWNGAAWLDVPNGTAANNSFVWRRFTFTPVATSAVRVVIDGALNNFSRITEIEAWTSSDAGPVTPPPPTSITLQPVASGFVTPLGIEHSGDGSGRLFVVEQGGTIKIVSSGAVLPTPFLDITSLVLSGGEQGLLGIAFHPNYATNGFFYINYTRQGDGATVIARYQRSASDPNQADSTSGMILLTVAQPFANHNGGQLRFGPDGYLYIALGDGGSGNDPGNRAQNLSTTLGKMLRIDVNNGSPYAIPATNPFQNDGNPGTLGEIWAYGLRNPWRFSFDRLTGDLFIADVGQNAWEEINFQPGGSAGGQNYGWRVMEGANCTGLGGGPACFDPLLTLPIVQYDHSLGCSITGGYRYHGSAHPALAGIFLYGDFCSGRIWGAAQYPFGFWISNQVTVAPFNISTFGEDQAGELYVAAYNTGVIYRISAP